MIYSCTFVGHENEEITGFCFNVFCLEKKRFLCSVCFRNKHQDHKNDCLTFNEIKTQIPTNVSKVEDWDRQVKVGFSTFQKISCGLTKFFFQEEKILIELENNLSKSDYQIQLNNLLKLKSWNDIIRLFFHQLQGDFLEVFLQKIDCFTETIFQKQNSLQRIKEINSQQAMNQSLNQIKMQNYNQKDYDWIIYGNNRYIQGNLLKNLIQCDQEKRQKDIKLIHIIIKVQREIISQWYLTIKRTFNLIKKIQNRWVEFVQNLILMQKQFNEAKYKEFEKAFNNSCYHKVDYIQINLKSQLLIGIIKKLTILFEALQQLQTTYENNNKRLLGPGILQNYQQTEHFQQLKQQMNESNRSIRVLEVATMPTCKKRGHENEPIVGYCFFKGCKENQQCCGQCLMNEHIGHKEGQKTIFQTKKMVEGQLSEIIQWYPQILDSFKSMERVSQNIEATLQNQLTKLIELYKEIQPSKIKDHLNNIKLLKFWNIIIQENLHHLENSKIQNFLYKINIVFQALQTFESTQNDQTFEELLQNSYLFQNYNNQNLYQNSVLISQQQTLNEMIETLNKNEYVFDPSGVFNTLQRNQIFCEQINSIILTYIQLIKDCIKVFNLSPQLLLIQGISEKIQITLEEKITQLQNQDINLDLLDQQIKFNKRFNIIIKQFFEKIICFAGELNNIEEMLGMHKQQIEIKNGKLQNKIRGNILLQLKYYGAKLKIQQDNSLLRNVNKVLKMNQLKLLSEYQKTLFEKGLVLKQQKQFREAISQFDQAIDLNSNYSDAHLQKGIALFNLKCYDQAIVEYDRAIILNPQISLAFFSKGYALQNINRWQDAIQNYDKAIQLNPKDQNSLFNKGYALQKLERYEEAVEYYDQAIQLNPKDYYQLFNKEYALQNLKRYEEAVKNYDQAIQLNPKNDNSFFQKGYALQKLERYEEAVEYYDQAIQLNPKDYYQLFNKEYALQNLNHQEEAVKQLQQSKK